MAKKKRTTIADVAKQADVSATTVSHFLNNAPTVSDDIRAKVLETIEELDYRPDVVARSLRQERPPQVFISYSRADWDDYAEPLVRRLEDEDLLIWVDQYAIRGGDDWLDGINLGLERCSVLILCVSPEALNSRYVKMEYRYFLEEEKPVIPVMCRKPAKLPAELRGIQYLPYAQTTRLVRQVKSLLNERE